jgi:hypothetical protein
MADDLDLELGETCDSMVALFARRIAASPAPRGGAMMPGDAR